MHKKILNMHVKAPIKKKQMVGESFTDYREVVITIKKFKILTLQTST